MTPALYRRDDCRLCGSSSLVLVFQLAPSPIGDAFVSVDRLAESQALYPIDLFLCQKCGLAQLRDVIDPDILYRDYLYATGSSEGLSSHFQNYVEDVLGRGFLSPGTLVVDLGSNDGVLLGYFKNHGFRTLGVDPAKSITVQATEAGIETLPLFFTREVGTRLRRERGPAGVMTANNVLANVDNLKDLVEGVRALLDPQGVFVMESYYLPDLLRNMVFDFIYHEHVSSFTVKPLRTFFNQNGLELFDAVKVPTKGGSVRYFVQHRGGPRPLSPRVESFVAEETACGVFDPKTFAVFANKVKQEKGKLHDVLAGLKAKDQTVAGYGACITGTTLVYHFGIGSHLEYLVDDNPAKQNLFSPGWHLPVYPATALLEKMPSHVLILAWRYAESIVRKQKAFLEKGGHFIVMEMPGIKIL